MPINLSRQKSPERQPEIEITRVQTSGSFTYDLFREDVVHRTSSGPVMYSTRAAEMLRQAYATPRHAGILHLSEA